MVRKKLCAMLAAISLSIGLPTVHGEQPAAESYRQIFRSGTFYVEYRDTYTTRIIAAENGQRMERTTYSTPGWVTFLNPLGAIFGGSGPRYPEVMYKDGNYYQFSEDNKATMLSEEHLSDENLDPRQGWNGISQKLALPIELAIFFWDDPFRDKTAAVTAPQFVESSRKKSDDKDYDCDRYSCSIQTADGNTEAQILYDALYDDSGQLVEIQSFIVANGMEYTNNTVKIKKLLPKVPQDAFAISKKTKVYAAGNGDMNDLLGQPVQIGQMGGLK